ncbi:MAG: pyrroloquinoline quinone-dependent dehydrogenase, partial [Anaerolineae bacterium]
MCLVSLLTARLHAENRGEWRSYGADKASSKYAPFTHITRDNVQQLRVVWRWRSVDQPILQAHSTLWTMVYEATPLMIGRVLYTSTSLSQVAAIEAVTGRTIWVYDPQTYQHGSPPNLGFVHRGVAYWQDGTDQRILIATGDAYLIALDAKTGKPLPQFGDQGRIDLTQGLRRLVSRAYYGVSSPPIVCRDVVVVGASIRDYPSEQAMPPGDVRGFDVRTGAQRWIFHSVPQGDEVGSETWAHKSWKDVGNTNVWAPMSCDEELGYVYLPFSTPSNDYYGGQRLGNNLFAESLVVLQAQTGQRVWHFQMVHHGLWDYDLPAAPNLVDITIDGKPIRAVAQVSKQGFCYVFDRVTGTPVWPIEERPVPPSTVTGERASPTQPFPTKPLPFDRQGVTPQDLIDFTPELHQEALQVLSEYAYGPLFTPPTEKGTTILPGVAGGASWSGAAFHPDTGMLYVPSVTLPSVLTLRDTYIDGVGSTYVGKNRFRSRGPSGLPLIKPPYGRITAIDLNTGEHRWMRPMGEGPRWHPALAHLNLPPLGWPLRSFPLLTKSVLFVAQQGIMRRRGLSSRQNALQVTLANYQPSLLALDPTSGKLIATIPLPGNATGAPMTYVAGGKQYIVFPIGGASLPAELVALSLP